MRKIFFLLIFLMVVSAFAQVSQYDSSGNLVLLSNNKSGLPTLRGPASQLVLPGDRSALSVSWSGSAVQFRWYFNGSLLAGETKDTLLLSSVSAQQVGNYFVVAQNSFGSVTSGVARVELDSDRDGLGDSWEIANFGSLTNQTGMMDADADGTANLLEFEDGTSPTNRNSMLARLTVATTGGCVVRSPDLTAYALDDIVTLTALPDPGLSFMGWGGALTGSTNPATLRLTGNASVQATFGLSLAQALNTTNLIETGGSGGWFGQTDVSIDGAAAAVAPPLAQSDDPFLQATVPMNKPGTATFDWRIDGEQYNQLQLWINGSFEFVGTRSLLGASDWQSKTVYLPAGTNTLRWVYVRIGGGWNESASQPKPRDTAYVDRLVIAEYTSPLLDADGNGLPDLWEYRFLDGIGNNPDSDPDGDGVTTKVELADGTDPNTKASVQPRVNYVVEGQGSAAGSPATNAFYYGQYVTNMATPALGWNFVAWVGPFDNDYFIPKLQTNNPSVDRLYEAKTFRAIFGLPLGTAVDSPGLNWTTSPDRPWYGQALVTQDGVHAAQSGLTVESFEQSESWLQTVVTGPGTLSFFWKASAAERDYLTLLANTNEVTSRLSGSSDWQPVVVALPSGQQTMRWLLSRNFGYDTNALNTVWVDQVKYTPGASKPEFIVLPAILAGYESADLTFRVVARGTPAITYQVFRNGSPLSQPATNESITISSVTAVMAGTWTVRAQNGSGFTESVGIPVTILPLPPNDTFASASSISGTNLSLIGYSIGATAETDEPSHDGYGARASVWYRWTAPVSGAIRFTAIATNPPSNLILAVYQGNSLATLSNVAADSANAQETNGLEIARVAAQWRTTAGASYAIAVDAGEGGAYFSLSSETILPPVNDAFALRTTLAGPFLQVAADNTLATIEPNEPALLSIPPFFTIYASNSLWWTWTAPASGRLHISSQSADTTALVSIFTGNSLSSLNRLTDPSGLSTSIDVVKGTTYAVSAGSYNDTPGAFAFLLSMDLLTLELIPPSGGDEGFVDARGPPGTPVSVQFSPNLKDWYLWASNNIPANGVLRVNLAAPTYQDQDEIISIPAAQKRFFRAVAGF